MITAEIIRYLRIADFPPYAVLLKDAELLANKSNDDIYNLEGMLHACLAAELYDICGDYEKAENLISVPADRIRQLFRTPPRLSDFAAVKLFKQQCWVLVHYGNTLYRRYKADEALTVFNECERILNDLLPIDPSEPSRSSFGLRSRIAYSQGIAYLREQNTLDARQRLSYSMDLQYQRYKTKMTKYPDIPDKQDEERARRHRLREDERRASLYMNAKIFGLGLGWCSLRAGELLRARAALSCSRIMFETSKDFVHKSFLDLLYAMTLRMQHCRSHLSEAIHGNNLTEAISLLRDLATDDGPFRNHSKYRARATYELAHALLDADREAPINSLLNKVITEADRNRVWPLNVQLLQARQHRMNEKWRQAATLAERVIEKAQRGPLVANAKLELAQSYIGLDRYLEAEKEIQQALAMINGSPVLAAACHLHRARCLAKLKKKQLAFSELDHWYRYRPRIEHGWIIDLANDVEAEVMQTSDRMVVLHEDAISATNFDQMVADFRGWICRQYINTYGEKWATIMSDKFNISQSTFFTYAKTAGVARPKQMKSRSKSS